eukprot:365682-Chlamydomonas_euryale.AAC.16
MNWTAMWRATYSACDASAVALDDVFCFVTVETVQDAGDHKRPARETIGVAARDVLSRKAAKQSRE